jgi:hydroxylaminobenzene mutase
MTPLAASRFLGRSGAILIAISLFLGFFVAGAMTNKVPADAHSALAAHLNAMLGAFWIFAVAWSVPHLRYGEVGLKRLAWLVVVPNYANWVVTAVKAFWKVSGVDFIGEGKNDTIFGLLTAFVVIPSIAAALAWAYGFRRATDTAVARASE